MSGPTGDATFSASEKPGRGETTMTLAMAQSMVPLVRMIAQDLSNGHHHLATLQPELERLDRKRHSLTWPERQRRYQVSEEVVRYEKACNEAAAELEALGVVLLDLEMCRIGFPTIVNDLRAFFSWRPGQEKLSHWHYEGDANLRLIPPSWRDAELSVSGRKR